MSDIHDGDWWIDLVDRQDLVIVEDGNLKVVGTLYGWDMLEVEVMVHIAGKQKLDEYRRADARVFFLRISGLLSHFS